VLAQCVGHDGGLSTDKFLNNPLACPFNPAKLLCTGNNASACLTQDKVNAIRKIFSGPPGIFPGYRLGAGEANDAVNWPEWMTDSGNPASATQANGANGYFQDIVFPNSGWTPNSFTIEENAQQAEAQTGAIFNAADPNLRPFKLRGGKLIQYAGWSDSAISPQKDIDYHRAVTEAVSGPEETQAFYRLFMVPGMGHCGSGPSANAFGGIQGVPNGPNPADPADDVLSALDQWVENGVAPEKIIATKYVNDDPTQGVAFQRPLCPFPTISKYTGTGSPTDAASFACIGGLDQDIGK
jgi:feruloyl esterase